MRLIDYLDNKRVRLEERYTPEISGPRFTYSELQIIRQRAIIQGYTDYMNTIGSKIKGIHIGLRLNPRDFEIAWILWSGGAAIDVSSAYNISLKSAYKGIKRMQKKLSPEVIEYIERKFKQI